MVEFHFTNVDRTAYEAVSLSGNRSRKKQVVTSFCFTFVVFPFSNSIIINEISLHFTPLFSYN